MTGNIVPTIKKDINGLYFIWVKNETTKVVDVVVQSQFRSVECLNSALNQIKKIGVNEEVKFDDFSIYVNTKLSDGCLPTRILIIHDSNKQVFIIKKKSFWDFRKTLSLQPVAYSKWEEDEPPVTWDNYDEFRSKNKISVVPEFVLVDDNKDIFLKKSGLKKPKYDEMKEL